MDKIKRPGRGIQCILGSAPERVSKGSKVLISIKPEWAKMILSGAKRLEVRKSAPKVPFIAYIYETKDEKRKGSGKVIGEFVCRKIRKVTPNDTEELGRILERSCLSMRQISEYFGWNMWKLPPECKEGYAWEISDLIIYESPKELRDFRKAGKEDKEITRPPQSWMYVS